MPGVCPNSWQMYGCENVIQYLWGLTDDLERFALLGLALMLVWTLFAVVRVSRRCHAAQHSREIESTSPALQRSRRRLVANLNIQVGSLKSIAFTAPYLGLAGTCLGLLGMFRAYEGTRFGALVMTVWGIEAAFISTAAGLLVAVPALLSHNYLRSRMDSLKAGIPSEASLQRNGHGRFAETLPLLPRLSQVSLAVIAAPALVFSIAAFVTYSSAFNTRVGLYVALDSAPCEYARNERLVVLRLTSTSKIFINGEETDWGSLEDRLSGIYNPRLHRILYLVAQDGVPFQRVVDAVDIAKHARVFVRSDPIRGGREKLNIAVQLVTPGALSDPCLGRARE
jgi:biopolymer transport protein ExbD